MKTAEEFFNIYADNVSLSEGHYEYLIDEDSFKEAIIEFAKMHVQESLKQALESIPCLGSSTDIASYEEIEDAVLNSYSLKNIK